MTSRMRVLLGGIVGALAVLFGVGAVLVGLQSAPTARDGSSLVAVDADGHRLTLGTGGGLILEARDPCVWPSGSREPRR